MASLGELFVAIRPDTKGFGGELSKGLNALMPVMNAAGIRGGGSLVAGMRSAMTGPAGIATVVVGATAAAGAALFGLGDDFNTVYRNIAAQSGVSMGQVRDDFKNVFAAGPENMDEVGKGLLEVYKMTGQTGQGAQELAKHYLDLARVTHTNVVTDVDAGTQALNRWNIKADEAAPALDTLFGITQQTGISFGDLTAGMKTYAPVLQQYGFNADTAASMFGRMYQQGLNIPRVMVGINTALSKTPEGMTGQGWLTQQFTAIKNAPTDMAATAIAVKTFGKKAGPELSTDIRKGALGVQSFSTAIDTHAASIVAAGTTAETFGQTWTEIGNGFKVALEPAATKMFKSISDGLKKIEPVLKPVLSALAEIAGPAIIGGVVILAAGFLVMAAPLLTLVAGIWLLVHGIETLVGWISKIDFGEVWDSISGFFTRLPGQIAGFFEKLPGQIVSFFTKLPGWIATGIGDLAHIGKVVIDKIVSGITTAASALWGWFKGLGGHILDAIGAVGGFLLHIGGVIIGGLVDGIVAAAKGIWDFFKKLPERIAQALGFVVGTLVKAGYNLIKGLVEGIVTAAGAIWDFFKKLPGRITGAAGAVGTWLLDTGKQILTGLWHGLETGASAVWDFFTKLPGRVLRGLDTARHWLHDKGAEILRGLVDGIETGAAAVWDFFTKLPGRVVRGLDTARHWLHDKGADVLRGLGDGLGAGASAIWDFFKRLPVRITGAVGAAGKWLYHTGMDIITGLFDGIWGAIKGVGGWINDHILKPFMHGILSAFGIASPAKKLIDVGKNIIEGLLHGITSVVGKVFDFFTGLPGKIIRAIGNVARTLWDKGKNLLDGLWDGIKNVVAAVVDYFTNLPGRFVRGLGNIARTLWDKGKDLLNGLWDGIKDVVGGIVDYFTKLPGRFVSGLGNIGSTLLDTGKNLGKGLLNGIIEGLNMGLDLLANAPIEAINVIIRGYNKIPLLPDIGTLDHVDVPNIPLLASGGTVTSGGYALVGEEGPELLKLAKGSSVLPASKLPAATAAPLPSAAAAKSEGALGFRVDLAGLTKGLDPAADVIRRKLPTALSIPVASPGAKETTKAFTDLARQVTTGGTNAVTFRKSIEALPAPMTKAGAAVEATTKHTQVFGAQLAARPGDLRVVGAALDRAGQNLAGFGGRTDGASSMVVGFGSQVRLRPGELSALGSSLGGGGDALRRFGDRTDGTSGQVVALGGQLRARPGELAGLGTSLGNGGGALDTFRGKADLGSGAVETFGGKLRDSPGNLAIMQHAVDIMHGKAFDVSATAKVNQPDWKALIAEAKKQLAAAGGPFADGGIHGASLPRDAVVMPAQPGGGLVQWAEPETGGEAFMPLAPGKRQRSLEVWRRTGKLLGAFAVGGLLDPDLKLLSDQWQPGIDTTANAANEFTRSTGQDFVDRSAAAAGKNFAVSTLKYLFEQAAAAAGGGGTGGGLADAGALVAYARSLLGHPYEPPYYGPNAFSCDGLVWWVFNHFGINTGRNAEYQIHNAQQISEAESKPGDVVAFKHAWNPSMIPGSTYGHIGIVTGPNETVNALGHAYGVVTSSITGLTSLGRTFGRFLRNLNPGGGLSSAAAGQFGATGPSGGPYSQGQMEASLRKFTNANAAHQLSAIGMAETGGRNFPNYIPGLGDGHGPYGFLARFTSTFADPARLDSSLDYASERAVFLYNQPPAGPTHGKWEVWPGLASQYLDEGGWLPPGSSLAINQTGQPERVIGPATDDALVTELRALPRKVGRAVADALNGVASYATMQV